MEEEGGSEWKEKERKQVVDERVTTSELEISTSPPAAPNHSDLLPPPSAETHSDDSALHSISLPASSFTLTLDISLLLPLAVFVFCFFLLPVFRCLQQRLPSFLKIEPELAHYRESFVSTPTN